MDRNEPSPWLARSPRHSAKVRLFCFPHSGGGPSAFRDWPTLVPPWVDIVPVQLPGRERRADEAPPSSLDSIVTAVTAAVAPHTDRPFALFGHSLGALLAYEVARHLHREGLPSPERLLVAGVGAPHQGPADRSAAPSSDEALLSEIEELGGVPPQLHENRDLLRAALPGLRADVALFTSYTHQPGPLLDCPVTVLVGEEDPLTRESDTSAWSEVTRGESTVHTFPGGHFFVDEHARAVSRTVLAELRRSSSPEPPSRGVSGTSEGPTSMSGTAGHGDAPDIRPAGGEPVAVVGIGCRFPGASGPEAFWRLLLDGVDAVTDVPDSRSGDHGVFAELPPLLGGAAHPRQGGFLDDVDGFDPTFFDISEREAARMDPQQRILLEVAWEALEDALVPPTSLGGSRTGVFMGQMGRDYWDLQSRQTSVDVHSLVGSGLSSFTSGRLSYDLDLRGPSVSLDTACSSSLLAVHLACQSLRTGESTLALAGGVNLVLVPELAAVYEQVGLMSRSGRCRFGDASGDGFVRSDGAGVVVLKPLARARADGDRVYAVVLGSVANNDGRSGSSLTAPGQEAQERLLADAVEIAGVRPSDVDYVEAHGTGTEVGDAIELRALANALGTGREPERPCRVGSAKSNIGHPESAAGIAGFIKAALSVHHREIPGNPLLRDPHPVLADQRRSLDIPVAPVPWPSDRDPVAGVTSFGLSGTNVHALLGAAPTAPVPEPSGQPLVLPISARDPAAAEALADSLADRIDGTGAAEAEWICAAAARGRSHHQWRAAVAANDGAGLATALREVRRGAVDPVGERPRIAFVFGGHGGQWHGMGRALLATSPAFRDALHECDAAIRAESGWSVTELLTGDAPGALRGSETIQPACWAMHMALAAYWRSWGVRPDSVLGHSFGEVAAACVSGAIGLTDGARLICRRAELTSHADGRGGMLAVGLPEGEVAAEITEYGDRVAVAAHNGPRSTVVSGDSEALELLLDTFDGRGVRTSRVRIPFAAHSAHMDPLRRPLVDSLGALAPRPTTASFRSTVTTRVMAGADLGAAYWGDNLREPVRFRDAVTAECAQGRTVFLEISPRAVLSPVLRQCLAAHQDERHSVVAGPTREEPESSGVARATSDLYNAGVDLDWGARYPAVPAPEDMPRYPWQRRSVWFTPSPRARTSAHDQPTIRVDVRRDGSGWSCAVTGSHPARVEIGPADDDGTRSDGARQGDVSVADRPTSTAPLPSDTATELAKEIADVLGVPPSGVSREKPLRLLGTDSLAAGEVRVRIERRWGVNVPATTVLESTIEEIAANHL
ncbi:type I polyketide synthase [Halostreptopolyspora alba]|uniref:Acyltransferase domain-containing protein n=1 Tax=Halostreptopolyspora alba TaxID=2487137 RepID=A0A3N0EI94_9ACTN|nr:acyltransferase domain-containing protein [Nocardiopsaceae bacterium YIM 96095]